MKLVNANNMLKELKQFLNRWIFPLEESKVHWSDLDLRDFNIGIFGWGEYETKLEEILIDPQSIKNQAPYNTCVFNGTCSQKEDDELKILSVKSMVDYAEHEGYISGDGYSSARDGQKVLKEFGAMLESSLPDTKCNSFEQYIDNELDYKEAAKFKISSFWTVNEKGEIIKLLEKGKTLTCVMSWYAGFNQRGGFSDPWLITEASGRRVGTHLIKIDGYIKNYNGREVYRMLNSYGEDWGDNGHFYVDVNYFHEQDKWECWANLDVKDTIGEFLTKYDGKNVKAPNNPAIYHIQKGKKKAYPDWNSYIAFNGKIRGFETVDAKTLNMVEEGDIMDIRKTDFWVKIKHIKKDKQIHKLLELINEIK